MVQHSQAKRGRDIKTKLMAAVVMLLVASIMMVSTTYAWFTLSTAPEVTGITTSVGANGNLEMALLPTYGTGNAMYEDASSAMAGIGNASGGETVLQSNITWGNLVNLSDASYGLGSIVLYPSELNIAKDETTQKYETALDSGALLKVPTYGSDGRVSGKETVSMTGVFVESAFYGDGYGVRAVGEASGMSALELAFRNAVAAGNTAANKANNAASTSLSASGTKLASMGIDRKLNNKTSYSDAEVQALLDVFNNLNSGALKYIDTALRNYIVAAYLATVTDANHSGTDATVEAILNPNTELSALADKIPESLANSLGTALSDYAAIETSVSASVSALTELIASSDSHTWESFSGHAAKLVDITTMLIEGYTIDHLTQKEGDTYVNIGPLVSAATSGKGLTMTTEGGLFADIAKFCGNIKASVKIENVNYSGVVLNINGTMVTNYVGDTYLPAIKTVVGGLTLASGGGGANLPISDYYGYVIDLAFRTNAAGSYLKLQSEGIDRVYTDNEANDATMGHGATMTFNASGVTGYDATNVVNLMECYRVVFYDPETMTIYGHARLDPTTVVLDDAGNYTMELCMYDIDAGAFKTGDDAGKIVELVQNEAKAVSVFVYLDGTTITNADVATSNISGKMNLQFASSAPLTPMEYADLREGSGAAAATTYTVTLPEGVTGETTANSGEAYTFTVTSGTPIVTVGGTAVTPTPGENGSYTIPADKVTGAIVITVA